MGCADGSASIFDCSARTWLCCLGTVYEYAAADGLNTKYYNYDQGAVCSLCCAGVLLHTFPLLLSWRSPAWCEGCQHILSRASLWKPLHAQINRRAVRTTNAVRPARCACGRPQRLPHTGSHFTLELFHEEIENIHLACAAGRRVRPRRRGCA